MAKMFDLVAHAKKLKGEMTDIYLDTKAWRKFRAGTPKLVWKRVKFDNANRSALPDAPGLYVFTLELEHPSFPVHGYILYIGMTGAGTSKATLRQRFGDYLNEAVSSKPRPAVGYMLRNWSGDLTFYYAEVSNKARISPLEDKLIAATLPPINRRIVDAKISRPLQAAFR